MNRHRRWITFALGAILLAAAVVAVARAGVSWAGVWSMLRAAPAGVLAVAVGATLLTVVLTAGTFHLLTNRYGRVGAGEMLALIGAAWLLNYLPMSPGMFGRLAYHKSVNRIALADSAKVLLWANLLSLVAVAMTLAVVVAASVFFAGDHAGFALIGALPIGVALLGAWRARAVPPPPDPHLWRTLGALTLRLLEIQTWAARYWACFVIIDRPLAWGACLALAAATTIATILPIAGNGLGVREWAVGLLMPLLPVGIASRAGLLVGDGLTADLVHRAIEVVVAVPIGLLAAVWVKRRLTQSQRRASDPAP